VPDPERQRREVAAQQLNNSGVYLLQCGPSYYAGPSHACKVRDCAGAIIEFQKALQQTPNDATILSNLQYARRLQKAEQTRDLLGKQWGDETPPFDLSKFPYAPISPNAFNWVNLDPSAVDSQGELRNSLPGTARSYLPAAGANALNAILNGFSAEVVDLSHATKTSVDPHALQTQIDGMFGKHGPHSEPPDPMVGGRQAEIKKLLQPSSEPDAPPQK
jgi:hypothetical protein